MKFTPDGLKLVSGARKDHRLLVWDIRYYRRPLNILNRAVDTNQRIYFDISPCGKYLVTGGTDGIVKIWDANVNDWTSSLDGADGVSDVATFKVSRTFYCHCSYFLGLVGRVILLLLYCPFIFLCAIKYTYVRSFLRNVAVKWQFTGFL